jgi:exodeoxyribonuclease V beta subunit
LQQAKIEAARENMRLAYVALTRATHRCVVYAGPFTYYGDNLYGQSPLAALLHVPEDAVDRLNAEVPHVDDPEALWSQVESVAAAAPSVDGAPSLVASRCTPPGLTRWQPPVGTEHPTLEARRYTRGGFDLDWRIHSYSRLTQGRHVAAAALEDPLVDRPGAADEPVDDAESIIPSEDDVPLAAFPGGVQAGTFLHAVLERADFTPSDEDLRRVHELQACIDRLARRHGFSARETAGLAEHLAETLAVPLGGSLGSFRLLDLPRRDRLDELRFDLPVQRASGDALARAFSAGADGEGGLRRPYVEALMDLDFATMAGFLTGSIDLVFRRGDRWFIVDYKSNRIDPERTGRTPISNYAQPFLQREMERHHYLVQAYLYTLALHRYLRHRLDDAYDPASHLGGVAYLFLRGMTQPDRPVGPSGREGVYHLRPAMPVVEALDALFEGSA